MLEESLKKLILSRYKSIREFALKLDMPYSTLDSIFKRGVENASIGNIIRICNILSISVDGLATGRIIPKHEYPLTPDETELVNLYRSLNDNAQKMLIETARAYAGTPSMQKEKTEPATAPAI